MVQTWYTKGWNKSLESSTWNLLNYQIAWTWWLASSQLGRVCWMWGVTMLICQSPSYNEGKIEAAIAGEVVEGPYQSALQNVADNGLEDKIEVRLADGLAAFEPADSISCITIAGMGGRLIADILAAGLEKLAGVSRLVLQPNNREDELRAWLVDHDFPHCSRSHSRRK